jgi:hypothetical protein
MQKALQELLYVGGGLQGARLSVLLNGALGVVARTAGGAFVDFDTVPEEGVGLPQALSYLLSPGARSLRQILVTEAVTAADVLLRQAARKAAATFFNALPRPPFFAGLLPRPETLPALFLLPTAAGRPAPALVEPERLLEAAAPRLTRDEELYAIALADLASGALGPDASTLLSGDAVLDPRAAARVMLAVVSSGSAPGLSALPPQAQAVALSAAAALAGQPVPARGGGRGGEASEGAVAEVLETVGNLTAAERATLDATVRQVRPSPPHLPSPPPPPTQPPSRPAWLGPGGGIHARTDRRAACPSHVYYTYHVWCVCVCVCVYTDSGQEGGCICPSGPSPRPYRPAQRARASRPGGSARLTPRAPAGRAGTGGGRAVAPRADPPRATGRRRAAGGAGPRRRRLAPRLGSRRRGGCGPDPAQRGADSRRNAGAVAGGGGRSGPGRARDSGRRGGIRPGAARLWPRRASRRCRRCGRLLRAWSPGLSRGWSAAALRRIRRGDGCDEEGLWRGGEWE